VGFRGQKPFGVVLGGRGVDILSVSRLDGTPPAHDQHPRAEHADHSEVMGDEDIGDPGFTLLPAEQIHDLRLDRQVQGRYWFVADNQPRQWDGYVVSRNRFTNFINRQAPANPVVLSGDWHAAFVNDVLLDHADPTSKIVATEFVGTSISSGCGWGQAIKNGLPANPHTRYNNPDKRGWTRCTVTADEFPSDYLVVESAADTASPAVVDASFRVQNGTPGAQRV
jgi:phosphodiesterase/alkaline phosphatase D-like protein